MHDIIDNNDNLVRAARSSSGTFRAPKVGAIGKQDQNHHHHLPSQVFLLPTLSFSLSFSTVPSLRCDAYGFGLSVTRREDVVGGRTS